MKRTTLAVAVGLAAAVAAGMLFATGNGEIRIPYEDAARVAEGQTLYVRECAECHGNRLEGQDNWQVRGENGLLPAPPHDVTGHTWHHSDAQLFDITRRGTEAVVGGGYRSAMPGFEKTLTDREILSVLAFIKSTWPDRVIQMHDDMNSRAQ